MLNQIIRTYTAAKNSGALIHCITNPISINQCANAVLAVGCKPIMAEHPREVSSITASSKALLLNLGNITDVRIKSMKISAMTARGNDIPFILDAVGAACSELRRKFACKIIEKYHPAVIKGNYSEINALYEREYRSSGVDADSGLDKSAVLRAAKALALKYNCVILASGKSDIITDGKRCVLINNGTSRLSCVTGTGCMLGALTACFMPEGDPFSASAAACAVMGIAGERADNRNENGSFLTGLFDEISSFEEGLFKDSLNMEVE